MEEKEQPVVRRKPLTSVDVARRAGVSRTAVSYVLNGTRSTHVSEETRAKVLQAAQELGYHLNTSAQALRKGQSNEICILSSVALSANDAEIFVAMQQHALVHGYIPVVYFIGGLTEQERRELLAKILARHPLALFLTPNCLDAEDIALAQHMGVSHILLYAEEPVEAHFPTDLPSVSAPTFEAGYLAAHHLLERGHRALGLVRPAEARHRLAFLQRLQGMRAAMSDAGFSETDVRLEILPMSLTMSDAYTVVDTHLTGLQRLTGVYTFKDEYALPLLGALSDRGIRVPEEVAIIGTDNVAFSAFVRPALTTISIDNIALGQRGIEMLAALQRGQALPEELTRPIVPQLLVRAST